MLNFYTADQFDAIPADPEYDSAQWRDDRPMAQLLVWDGDAVTARCSIWWEGTPTAASGLCGTVGHFSAQNKDAAGRLLAAACNMLRKHGCAWALAPMNGNTWRSYRYATGGQERPSFLMEPPPALDRDAYLQEAGFAPVNRYASYIEPLEGLIPPETILHSLKDKGFLIRDLDMGNLRGELDRVYDLAVLAFQENPYYTDLPREAFIQQYLAYRELLQSPFIPLAYHGDTLAGFLFCIPNYLESKERPRTLLLKTLAVLPPYRSMGLGGGLMALAKSRAHTMGFNQGIGALVYRGNISEKLCRAGQTLREYTLFGRAL